MTMEIILSHVDSLFNPTCAIPGRKKGSLTHTNTDTHTHAHTALSLLKQNTNYLSLSHTHIQRERSDGHTCTHTFGRPCVSVVAAPPMSPAVFWCKSTSVTGALMPFLRLNVNAVWTFRTSNDGKQARSVSLLLCTTSYIHSFV